MPDSSPGSVNERFRTCLLIEPCRGFFKFAVVKDGEVIERGAVSTAGAVRVIQVEREIILACIETSYRTQECMEAAASYGWGTAFGHAARPVSDMMIEPPNRFTGTVRRVLDIDTSKVEAQLKAIVAAIVSEAKSDLAKIEAMAARIKADAWASVQRPKGPPFVDGYVTCPKCNSGQRADVTVCVACGSNIPSKW